MTEAVKALFKYPPILQEGNSYEEWKRDFQIWQLLKLATKTDEGPLVYRTLTGRSKSAVSDLTPAQIGSNNGLDLIIERLDKLHLNDKNQRIFVALDTFEKFKRPSNMSMSNFIVAFENLHNSVKMHQCTYPDGVLAYRLLKSANLSPEQSALCKATVETDNWTYDSVVNQLRKIFSELPLITNSPLAIKTENTFQATSENVCHHCNPEKGIPNELNDEYFNENYYDEGQTKFSEPSYQDMTHPENSYTPTENHDIYYAPFNNRQNPKFRAQNRFNNFRQYSKRPGFQTPAGHSRVPTSRSQFEDTRPPTAPELKSLKSQYSTDPCATNPKDTRGNYTICRRCRSIYHWVADCPHLPEGSGTYFAKNVDEEVYIALLQSCQPKTKDEICELVSETFSKAVIDSGCTKTVAGQNWFADYLKSLSDDEASNLQYIDSCAQFRFGDSEPVTSLTKVLLPIVMGGKSIYLATEIVPSDVPLLLSKNTLKDLKANMDYVNDKLTIFGNTQEMVCTNSGHYAIPITKNPISSLANPHNAEPTLVMLASANSDYKTTARKLHQQFSHPRSQRLIDFIKSGGIDNEDLFEAIEKITTECDTCRRYSKSRPRPVVSFPMANEFNETVGIDLKIYENNKIYFLHMVDHLTRYSAAAVIRSKRPEVIIDNIFKFWIAIFGAPKKFLSDNGGEFANSEFADMCENLNINFRTTSAESPFSNGLVEKQNDILGEAVSKILEEVNCSIEVALCWAVNAKNSLHNIYGFSPYQLVFGRNPNLPTALQDKLPALEGMTESQLVAKHLNSMHKAREEFIKLETSEKLRRALRAKTRTHNNIKYLPGEEVFFKREDERRWKGPGRVIGQDGSKVLIKTPYSLISVHSSRVILTSKSEGDRNLEQLENQTVENSQPTENLGDELPSSGDIHIPPISLLPIEMNSSNENAPPEIELPSNNEEIVTLPIENLPELVEDPDENIQQLNDNQPEENDRDIEASNIDQNDVRTDQPTSIKTSDQMPKVHQCVKFRTVDSQEWKDVKILSRAGKAGGKYQTWLNFKNLTDDTESSMDWNTVSEWTPIEFQTLYAIKEDRFKEAREKELDNWKIMKVYDEVEDDGQEVISVKWVYKEKVTENESRKKARLVARGYEEEVDGIGTDSPTCSKDSLRVVLSIASANNWEVNSLDVTAAFLQGKELDRDVYLRPPKEAGVSGKLWKLRRCVYGLNDASRYWYLRVRDELLKAGCKCSKSDPSVFFLRTESLQGILISHVDDLLWCGTSVFKSNIVDTIRSIFKIREENVSAFTYVGIEIYQDKNGIYLTQQKYLNDLEEVHICPSRKNNQDLPLNREEKRNLRAAIGRLNWLATQTRPELSYGVSELSSCVSDATIRHLIKANKLIRSAKMDNVHLFFPSLILHLTKVRVYADASFGKQKNGASQMGMFIELTDGSVSTPIAWQSKRINRVVGNIMSAETLAAVNGLDAGYLIASLLSELVHNNKEKVMVEMITDSNSFYESAHAIKSVKDRRLRIDLSIVKQYVINNEATITWVPSEHQLADVLTKDGIDRQKLISHIKGLHY